MIKKIFGLLLFGAALLSMQGCAPSVYAVDPPEASKYVFDGAGSQSDSRLNIIDGRDDQYTSFPIHVIHIWRVAYGANP
jgi:hypothetical protein